MVRYGWDDLSVQNMLSGEQARHNSRTVGREEFDVGMEDLFAGLCEPSAPKTFAPSGVGPVGGEFDGQWAAEEESGNEEGSEGNGPTREEGRMWRRAVVVDSKERVWKDHSAARLQARCFAVEWRGSVLLDREEFVRQLFDVLGEDGGEASFVVGMEVRESRADYMAVVRLKDQTSWRDWRKALGFAHGGGAEGEGLFVRVRVPLRGSAEGTQSFITDMAARCEVYEDRYRYREAEMTREHSKAYARPGRKRKVDDNEDV